MIPWSVTTLSSTGPTVSAGHGRDQGHATELVIRAAKAAVAQASSAVRPRYLLHVNDRLIALVDTGLTAEGFPDHREAAELLERLYSAPTPDPEPCPLSV
jgi:hypothetical protein